MTGLILAQATPVTGPMVALAAGVLVVVLAIAKWKIHPFFELMGAGGSGGPGHGAGGDGRT